MTLSKLDPKSQNIAYENNERFLDTWWDVDPDSFSYYHKTTRGKGMFMIVDFLKEEPKLYEIVKAEHLRRLRRG